MDNTKEEAVLFVVKSVNELFDEKEERLISGEMSNGELENSIPPELSKEQIKELAQDGVKLARNEIWSVRNNKLQDIARKMKENVSANQYKDEMSEPEKIAKMTNREFQHHEQGTEPTTEDIIKGMSKDEFRRYEAKMCPAPETTVMLSAKPVAEKTDEYYIEKGKKIIERLKRLNLTPTE